MTIQKKITKKIKEKKGLTLIGILLGAVAFGLLAFPMARWVMQMTQNIAANERSVAALGAQLEMQAIMEDRWHIINDMSIDQLKAATTKTTTYGKYSVKEEYATAGKYNASTGACASGTASGTEQLCRQVTLTVTGPAGTTPLGPVKAFRVATPSSRMANLETRVAAAEKKFGDYSTTAQMNTKFGDYYTKSQINSTLGSYATTAAVSNTLGNYYTKAQVDSKDTTINNKFSSYYTSTQTDSKIAAVSSSGSGLIITNPSAFVLTSSTPDSCGGGYSQSLGTTLKSNYSGDYSNGSWPYSSGANKIGEFTYNGKQYVFYRSWEGFAGDCS